MPADVVSHGVKAHENRGLVKKRALRCATVWEPAPAREKRNYTTIARGVGGPTGIAVSEAYKLNN